MRILLTCINLSITAIIILCSLIAFLLSFKNFKNEPLYVHPAFVPTFEQFKKDANKFNTTPLYSGLTTTFVDDIGGEILGYCLPKFNAVRISRAKWNKMGELNRKLLLYHEWGHCTLKREHVEEVDFLCPTSIMHPYLSPTISCYPSFKDWYDKELFTNPLNKDLINKGNYEAAHSI
jgi:hypothetical protein